MGDACIFTVVPSMAPRGTNTPGWAFTVRRAGVALDARRVHLSGMPSAGSQRRKLVLVVSVMLGVWLASQCANRATPTLGSVLTYRAAGAAAPADGATPTGVATAGNWLAARAASLGGPFVGGLAAVAPHRQVTRVDWLGGTRIQYHRASRIKPPRL